MPNGFIEKGFFPPPAGKFQKELAKWEKESQLYQEQARTTQQQMTDYGKQMEALTPKQPITWPEKLIGVARPLIMEWGPLFPSPAKSLLAKRVLRENISQAAVDLERNDFFARLYSEVPIAISVGQVSSADEVLTLLNPPSDLTADELSDIRNTISNMIAVITKPPEVLEPGEIEYPPLVAPVPTTRVPVSTHQLSTQELLKTLKTPVTPESAMTKAEWEEFLKLKGYTDEDIDKEQQILAEGLIASWADRNSQLAAFKSGLAEMPEYKLTDMLKEMVVQPGLALAEVGMMYFEHVSMPLAGMLYKNLIPDLEAEYQRYKAANPDAPTWGPDSALVHAWVTWDSPFEGVAEWILKYMLMEGLVDPLTYAGWGIATRLTRPIPYVGRLVGAAERGIASVFELPFDAIKYGWTRVIPRTMRQRATLAQTQAAQYVERFLTKTTGRHLFNMDMRKLTQSAERSIKYALDNPQLEDDIALAGREMLKHAPVDESIVMDWSSRVGTSLRPEDVTRATVENIDNLFEDMFMRKLITNREAAGQLLKILNVGDMSDAALKTAQRILEARSKRILTDAMSFTTAKTPVAAVEYLALRNFNYHMATEASAAALSRKEVGAVSALLMDLDPKLQAIWRNGIDRWVVRPFAESYLTFGMYGPMNVIEDYLRSALGGVMPRRMTDEAWRQMTIGLIVDPNTHRYGMSEMIGALAREGPRENWNNWVLQLAAFGQKRWADAIYKGLVRLPGAYGMDVRRNFLAKKYLQLLAENGGDAFLALAKTGPKKVPPEVIDAGLRREVARAGYYLKSSGKPELAESFKLDFTRKRIVRNEVNNILKEHSELPNTARDYIMKAFDDGVIFREAGESIESTVIGARNILLDDFIRGPEVATQQYHQLADFLTALEVRNPQEMASAIQAVHKMSEIYGALPDQIIAQATIRSRGLPLAERRATFDADFDRIYTFLDAAGADIDRVITKIRASTIAPSSDIPRIEAQVLKLKEAYNTLDRLEVTGFQPGYLSKAELNSLQDALESVAGVTVEKIDKLIEAGIKGVESIKLYKATLRRSISESETAITELSKLTFSDSYKDASTRLFDTMTAKREFATEFRAQNMATRSEIFAGVSKKEMTPEFWDGFYLQMSNEYRILNTRMAELDGQIVRAIEEMNRAAGAKITPRTPVVVKDRPLAPQDIATLLGVRGDDISRSLLDVLTVQNNKEFFVTYVQAMARPGDIGFTKESIGAVYDQLAYSLRVTPETMSWITSKQLQLDAVRKELHSLYNSKMLPDEEIAAIGRYLDDTADAVERLMFTKAPRDVVVRQLPEEQPGILTVFREDKPVGSVAISRRGEIMLMDELAVDTPGIVNKRFLKSLVESLEDEARAKGLKSLEIVSMPKHKLIYEAHGFKQVRMAKEFPVMGKSVPPAPPAKVLKSEYANFDDLRQSSMDEAHKWYYKEYPDYTNANAFDALMKTIYPYWTYESQRWFWLPRSFVRHPGLFTTFERWQNNSEYGYIHIPNTSVDINPFRGTIFGSLTTRLTRRDFPEYFDSLQAAKGMIEFNDYLSRFGFYPGAHISIPLSLLGGSQAQLGETVPAILKTPLDALIALFPESESVKWLSDRVFSDRFRDYMTIIEANKRGYNGSHIWSKMKEGRKLTEEEESVWFESRSEAAFYSAGFSQFGLFRLRTDEQYKAYEESAKVIEEMTGYTPDQQNWLRRHGYRIWDMVGGLSPTNQAILQTLESYKWLGSVTPLLPSRQQQELTKLDVDWDDVMQFAESAQAKKLSLQQDFLSGILGPRDYNTRLQTLYSDQRTYIDKKMEENPNMTLEGRKEYYKKYGIPIPVQHPMKELLNLYFSIELQDKHDEETGELVVDWDTFFAQRQAIEDAIPEDLKGEWEDYLSRNSTRVEELRRDVSTNYFRKYYDVWEASLALFPEEEQKIINEFLYLERTGQQLERQGEIKGMISSKTGLQLISSFRSDVSDNRAALRYANPHLDAWLFYWGRTTSFKTPQAETIYRQIARDTGRMV